MNQIQRYLLPRICLMICLICNGLSPQKGFSQALNPKGEEEVSLIDWKLEDCNHTYDPNLLISRITHIEEKEGLLKVSISFSDNCCPNFRPNIRFEDNKLMLFPYPIPDTQKVQAFCFCDCCFNLEYQIAGLPKKAYDIYFAGEKVVYSEDHYATSEPTYEWYQNCKINQKNKYGFGIGSWIMFHEDSSISKWIEFPPENPYGRADPLWSSTYYPSGKKKSYSKGDSTHNWFEDGELESVFFKRTMGDTTHIYTFQKYDNRQLEEKTREKSYFLDIPGCGSAYTTDIEYKELYYRNGQRSFLYTKDSTYSWFENGQLKHVSYEGGEKTYTEEGELTNRIYSWHIQKSKCLNLKYKIEVAYGAAGKVNTITYFSKDTEEGTSISYQTYTWKWDDAGRLLEKPQNWEGQYPWSKFEDLALQLKGYTIN